MRSLFILTLITFQIFAQKQPLSNRIANYDIDVKLDVSKKMLTGKQTLYWTNNSTDHITELHFHAYLNAFKDKNSTFMKESGGQLRGDKMEKEDKNNWGYNTITSIKIRDGESLYSKIKFFQPDDLNENDKTVFKVQLPKPLKPNERIVLDIDFKAKLPKIFARTGFVDDYFLVGSL
jgi:hypothetical protein